MDPGLSDRERRSLHLLSNPEIHDARVEEVPDYDDDHHVRVPDDILTKMGTNLVYEDQRPRPFRMPRGEHAFCSHFFRFAIECSPAPQDVESESKVSWLSTTLWATPDLPLPTEATFQTTREHRLRVASSPTISSKQSL